MDKVQSIIIRLADTLTCFEAAEEGRKERIPYEELAQDIVEGQNREKILYAILATILRHPDGATLAYLSNLSDEIQELQARVNQNVQTSTP